MSDLNNRWLLEGLTWCRSQPRHNHANHNNSNNNRCDANGHNHANSTVNKMFRYFAQDTRPTQVFTRLITDSPTQVLIPPSPELIPIECTIPINIKLVKQRPDDLPARIARQKSLRRGRKELGGEAYRGVVDHLVLGCHRHDPFHLEVGDLAALTDRGEPCSQILEAERPSAILVPAKQNLVKRGGLVQSPGVRGTGWGFVVEG
jgi:hypothetical protein